jgi:hypothetical protein
MSLVGIVAKSTQSPSTVAKACLFLTGSVRLPIDMILQGAALMILLVAVHQG